MRNFEIIFQESKIILTEGAIAERLKSEFKAEMDCFINHAGVIYSNPGILEFLYKQYIDIARKYNLPIMIMTPTRKVNYESIPKSKFPDRNIESDSCVFLNKIRDSYPDYSCNILLGGLLGCKGDAYRSEDALGVEESYVFHKVQVQKFEKENIDFLFAGIMPEINEAVGMAKAMDDTDMPHIISFMIRKDGRLIDRTPISEAIKTIDKAVIRKPLCYMTNCVHPANLLQALSDDANTNQPQMNRFKGIQANASVLNPEELNNCGILQQNDFDAMVDEMQYLHKQYDLKILGGCCGTDNVFIEDLAMKISGELSN